MWIIARITAESGVRVSAVYRQEDTGALSITLGILEHLHVHFKLAGKRDHVDQSLDYIDVAALQRAAAERDLDIGLGLAAARQPEQPIQAARELGLGRIDQLDAANCRGDLGSFAPAPAGTVETVPSLPIVTTVFGGMEIGPPSPCIFRPLRVCNMPFGADMQAAVACVRFAAVFQLHGDPPGPCTATSSSRPVCCSVPGRKSAPALESTTNARVARRIAEDRHGP